MPETKEVAERVGRIEEDLYRTHPDNPGAILRLDRIERLLNTMLKIGGVLLGCGLLFQFFEVVRAFLTKAAIP
jgi:hypothetical protein